jgi:hypothetical protein
MNQNEIKLINYATFLPQALHPGLALCTRSIIGAFNGRFLGITGGLLEEANTPPKLLF